MKRNVTLGLAVLVAASVVVLALWHGLRRASEATPTAALPSDAPVPPARGEQTDELTPPAPDAAAPDEHSGEPVAGDRIETPDPLEAAVTCLRTANPHLYASLTVAQARELTEIHLGAASVSDADVAEFRKLPALKSISVSDAGMESLGKLLTLRSKRVEIRNHGSEVLVYLSR